MTKKHFIALARALRDTNASFATIAAIADICASTNRNFNRDRFYEAVVGERE